MRRTWLRRPLLGPLCHKNLPFSLNTGMSNVAEGQVATFYTLALATYYSLAFSIVKLTYRSSHPCLILCFCSCQSLPSPLPPSSWLLRPSHLIVQVQMKLSTSSQVLDFAVLWIYCGAPFSQSSPVPRIFCISMFQSRGMGEILDFGETRSGCLNDCSKVLRGRY
jgi:hypothetical protein